MRNERPVTTSSLENPENPAVAGDLEGGGGGSSKTTTTKAKYCVKKQNKTKKVEEGRVGSTRSALNRDLK